MGAPIYKFVLTGGPCAGKSTAISKIKENFIPKNFHVLVVPETATELMTGGITPWNMNNSFTYQILQMDLHYKQEATFEYGAEILSNYSESDGVIIIYDRGQNDCKAYMGQEEFDLALKRFDWAEQEWLNHYDAVFHMCTAAYIDGLYKNDNNKARHETAEEAKELDKKILNAWKDHPYRKILPATQEFEHKINSLLNFMEEFIQIYK